MNHILYFYYAQISVKMKEFAKNSNKRTGGVPSYQLFLCLNEIIKLADNIPSRYVNTYKVVLLFPRTLFSLRPNLYLTKHHQWFKCFFCDWITAVANKSYSEMKRAIMSTDKVKYLSLMILCVANV